MQTGKKILIVDDNVAIRTIVSEMLSNLGYIVSSAENGEDALALFYRNKFDFVLSDYEMPGMDGISLACRIKQLSPFTPVVIMTGSDKESVHFQKNDAVNKVLSKPFGLLKIDETFRKFSGKALCAQVHQLESS